MIIVMTECTNSVCALCAFFSFSAADMSELAIVHDFSGIYMRYISTERKFSLGLRKEKDTLRIDCN